MARVRSGELSAGRVFSFLVFPSAACLASRFPKPPQPIVLKDCQVLPLPPDLPLTQSQELSPGAPPVGPQPRPPTAVDPNAEPTLIRHPQVRALGSLSRDGGEAGQSSGSPSSATA